MAFEMRLASACRTRSGSAQTCTPLPSRLKPDAALSSAACCRLAGALEQQLRVATCARMQLGVAAADALDVEDVVDELDEPVGVADGDFEHLPHLFGPRLQGAAGDEAKRRAQAGERGAQLVRDGGDELVLHAVERASLGGVGETRRRRRWRRHAGPAPVRVHLRPRDVFDGEAAAILAPEDFARNACGILAFTAVNARHDGAFAFGVGLAVGAGVQDEFVQVAAEQFIGPVAEHLRRRRG